MDIVETPEFQIFLVSETVETGRVWDSVTPPGYWLGALLEGDLAVRQGLQGERPWMGGGGAVFAADQPVETRHRALAGGRMSAVFLRVERTAAQALLGEEAIGGFTAEPARLPGAARTIAWQMMGCRLQGAARSLYLRGKALEMAACAIAPPAAGASHRSLTPREIEILHEARRQLEAQIADPPALPDLALQLGISLTRLGQGYRQLFGAAPWAWLKERRLDHARQLIETRQLSVSDAARRVGYQPQHFATEFRKRFGMPPSSLRAHR